MPFRPIAVACAAFVAAGFLLAPAAQASSRPVQVNGNKLLSALLPASAFGSDFQRLGWDSSGKRLWHKRATDHVASMSCANFEDFAGLGRFGETAAADSLSVNSDPLPAYPNTQLEYLQSVYQFPSAKAAASYYSQAHAKYVTCKSFTESVSGDAGGGGGSIETTTLSVSKTRVGKYQAFRVSQAFDFSDLPALSFYTSVLVTVEGTDVLTVLAEGGTNDPIPAALMQKLINRVRKLR